MAVFCQMLITPLLQLHFGIKLELSGLEKRVEAFYDDVHIIFRGFRSGAGTKRIERSGSSCNDFRDIVAVVVATYLFYKLCQLDP